MEHDQPQVQLAALRAVCDVLLVYSPAELLGSEATDPSVVANQDAAAAAVEGHVPVIRTEDNWAHEVGRLIVPMLDESGALRTTATLGLAKLMHAGVLTSTSTLAKLLLVCFDGSYADGNARKQAAELSQQLSLFFAASGQGSALAAALLSATRAVFAAADGSRESSVPAEAVISFVVGLVAADADGGLEAADDDGAVAAATTLIQMCMSFCCEALLNLNGDEAKVLPRAFASMTLPPSAGAPSSRPLLAALRELLEDLAAGVDDKTAAKGVEKMRARVDELLGDGADEEGEPLSAGQILSAHKALKVADAASAKACMPLVDKEDDIPILPKASKLARSKMTGRTSKDLSSENMCRNAIAA